MIFPGSTISPDIGIHVLPDGQLPKKARPTDACADCAYCGEGRILVNRHSQVAVPLGFQLRIPEGWVGRLWPRSGNALHCGWTVHPANIDPGFHHEVCAIVQNLSDETIQIDPGDRVAQIEFSPVWQYTFVEGSLMSLNPSNLIAARTNPDRTVFPNLACSPETLPGVLESIDAQVTLELHNAGIAVQGPYEFIRKNSEVPTAFIGSHCCWSFKRAWYYWVAEGPGVPADRAEEFHKTWGTQVRVDGHCGCPSPLEHFHGFAVSLYHIDTQEGLNAFAALLRSIYIGESEDG